MRSNPLPLPPPPGLVPRGEGEGREGPPVRGPPPTTSVDLFEEKLPGEGLLCMLWGGLLPYKAPSASGGLSRVGAAALPSHM